MTEDEKEGNYLKDQEDANLSISTLSNSLKRGSLSRNDYSVDYHHVNQRIFQWENLLMQVAPTSEELAFVWKKSKAKLLSSNFESFPDINSQTAGLALEKVNIFRVPNCTTNQLLLQFFGRTFTEAKVKYYGLVSGVYNSKPFKPPIRVVPMVGYVVDRKRGERHYWISILVKPQIGFEFNIRKIFGRRKIAIFPNAKSSNDFPLFEREWNIYFPDFSEDITSESIPTGDILSSDLRSNRSREQNFSEISSRRESPVNNGVMCDRNVQSNGLLSSSANLENVPDHQALSSSDESSSGILLPCSKSSTHYSGEELKELSDDSKRQKSSFVEEIKSSTKDSLQLSSDALRGNNTLSTRRSHRFSQRSLASLMNSSSIDELETFPSINVSSPTQGFMSLNIGNAEKTMCSEKYFLIASHGISTVVSSNFKVFSTDSICRIEDNQVFEWSRGILLKDWIYKWPSRTKGFGHLGLRYFILKDNLLLYSACMDPAKSSSEDGFDTLESKNQDGVFTKGLVLTSNTIIEETANLFRSCVKIYSDFSDKSLYLHFRTKEQQILWVESIRRVIHLHRLRRESISMTTKVQYYTKQIADELVAVDVKYMRGSLITVSLFRQQNAKHNFYINVACNAAGDFDFIEVRMPDNCIDVELNLVKLMYLATNSSESVNIKDLLFVFGGSHSFIAIGYFTNLDQSQKVDTNSYIDLETGSFDTSNKDIRASEILYMESMKILILFDSSKLISFWKIFISSQSSNELTEFQPDTSKTFGKCLRFEFQSTFTFSKIYQTVSDEFTKDEMMSASDVDLEKILSVKLINNFLLNENIVNLDIINNNPNEIYNLLIGTNFRMILLILGFLSSDNSFGVIGFVELNNISNHCLTSSNAEVSGLFDLTMSINISEKSPQQQFFSSIKSPFKPINSDYLTHPSTLQSTARSNFQLSNNNLFGQIHQLHRTNSLHIEKRWVEWAFYPSEQQGIDFSLNSNVRKEDSTNDHEVLITNPSRNSRRISSQKISQPRNNITLPTPVIIVKRYERTQNYFKEFLHHIHYFN